MKFRNLEIIAFTTMPIFFATQSTVHVNAVFARFIRSHENMLYKPPSKSNVSTELLAFFRMFLVSIIH